MEISHAGRDRFLSVLHICVGLALLPLSYVFGFLLVPIVALVPLWMIVLGIKLWRSSEKAMRLLRRTHYILIILGAIMIAYGIYCLWRAHLSAMEGGGLLGAFGVIPILYGILLGVTSVISLVIDRKVRC